MIQLRRLIGEDLSRSIDALASLRIEVFREFPYLYDGNEDYERKYLRRYLNSPRCVMIAAYDGKDIVGAASALPLSDEDSFIQAPFRKARIDLDRVFYFGESVLRRQYRGQGLGNKFFDERESVARSYGQYNITGFCAVQRAVDHPLRPSGYFPLDEFWKKRGYSIRPDLESTFEWRDIDQSTETSKKMIYWLKEWT